MSRVLLFDIDGTLVHAGGAGRRALERALTLHCGVLNGAIAHLRLDGMTDRLIVREAMVALGMPFEDALCDRVLESYVEHLVGEIQAPTYRVLPGVAELLETLSRSEALIGLCTGNVVGGARIKLGRGGLDRFFDWSDGGVNGFAADGEARECIVEAVLRRANRRLSRRVDPREVLIIGDTPRDVEAARAAGVPVLGVATGRFSVRELRECGADRVVETLAEPDLAERLLSWPQPA
jgi:phosphoglycolate phosphatase